MTRLTFPDKPSAQGYFREPSSEPRVEWRWQSFDYNNSGKVEVRYYGMCLNPSCRRATFATYPGGLGHEALYNYSLVMLPVDIGTDEEPNVETLRFCYHCAQSEVRVGYGIEEAKRMRREDPKAVVGPIVWPDKKPKKKRVTVKRTDPVIAA